MLAMIVDIEKAANAGAYRSALALALTIPDICGQIAYPDCENTGARYRRWFNEYVKKYYSVDHLVRSLGIKPFDAQACYKLRCAYLHSGNSKLQDVDYIQTLDFFTPNREEGYLEDKGYASLDMDMTKASNIHFRLNIAKLCAVLCAEGRAFCSDPKYSSLVKAYDISIFDAQEELLNLEEQNGQERH